MKKKTVIIIFLSFIFLQLYTSVFAEYTGPLAEKRRYTYVCGTYSCNCQTSGCGGEDTGGTHTDAGSGVSCQGNSPQVFCDTCKKYCKANYPDAAISLTATCSTGFGQDGWCRGDVTVTATATDKKFQITGIENSDGTWLTDSSTNVMTKTFTFSGEQMRTVEFWAHSGLGDTSSKATYTVKIDLTDPVNYIDIQGTLSADNWYKGSVQIISTAQDTFLNFTKVDPQYWDVVYSAFTTPDTFTGHITPKIYTEDLAGNYAGWDAFDTIHIDNAVPTIKSLYDPQGKWFSTPVPLFVLGEDITGGADQSGVLSGYIFVDGEDIGARGNAASASYIASEGTHTVTYQVEDRANNKSAVTGEYTFGFDVTAPVISLDSNQSFDIVGPIVTVSGTVTDNLSGIKSVEIKYGKKGNWLPVTGQPVTGSTDGTWSHTMNRVTAEGYNMFYIRAVDVAGNYTSGTNLTFTLNHDYTAPETIGMHTEGTKGEGGVYNGTVKFIGDAEDSVAGVKSIFIDLGLGDGEQQNSAVSPDGFSGIIRACVRAVDNVDNTTECVPQEEIMIDNTKPTVVAMDNLDLSRVFLPEDTFTVTGADALSGMYSVTITLDGTEFVSLGDSNTINLGALGDGTHTIEITLKDNAGNILDSSDDASLRISGIVSDGTKPVATLVKPIVNTYGKDALDIEGSISDNIGINKAEIRIDGIVVLEYGPYTGTSANIADTLDITSYSEGEHTVELIVYDKAGNASEAAASTFTIDRTAPSVSVSTDGVKGDGGFYRGTVTFIGNAEDSGSGVLDVYVDVGNGEQLNTATSPEDFSGYITACVRAVDNLGNDSGCIEQEPILIDNTAPYPVSYTDLSSKAVFVAGDTFDVTGKDDHSGVYSVTFVLDGTELEAQAGDSGSFDLSSVADGTHTIEFILTDNAGNVYSSAEDPSINSGSVTVDTTGPEVVLNQPSENQYVSDRVEVSGSVSDNIGAAKVVVSVDGQPVDEIELSGTSDTFHTEIDTASLPEGEHTITVQAFDRGGNPSNIESRTIVVDHTAPECHIEVYGERGAGGYFRGEVKLVAVCSDGGSGVEKSFINPGDGRVENEIVMPGDYTGEIAPKVAGVDKSGNDSGDENGQLIVMPDGTILSAIMIDNNPPRVTDYFIPEPHWINVETSDLFVAGEDDEGALYSGTIIVNGNKNVVLTEDDRAEIVLNVDEGVSSLVYYVTDLAGNTSAVIGYDW